LELKGNAALSLLSLLEDDTDLETRAMFPEMAMSLDIPVLLRNLEDLFQPTSNTISNVKTDEKSEQDTGFVYAMLLATLLPFMSDEFRIICEKSAAFRWFRERTGKIEILRELVDSRERRLYCVLFPIPNICFYMRKDSKQRFLWMKKRLIYSNVLPYKP
jgi:hypothetical protein